MWTGRSRRRGTGGGRTCAWSASGRGTATRSQGRVGAAGEDAVTLLVEGALREVRYADVAHAAVEVEFAPPPEKDLALLDRGTCVGPGPGAAAHGVHDDGSGGPGVNVDIAALRAIEREKDIPFETVIEAIETALLTAYKHTEGHQPHARVDIDRKTGVVRVLRAGARRRRRAPVREWDDTPRASAGSPPPPRAR